MSHENSMQINQSELASEYGRYVESKSNKGIMRLLVKALLAPLVALLITLTGAAFAIANFSPAMYTQAKDIIFATVDIEKMTGLTDAASREYLDNMLILNSEQQPGEDKALEENEQQEQIQPPLN